ncbi:sensor histidine kinase [Ghiorsea bivora]|uniref:sensor histidine kinase n=1 Tax=Ghiorsea bivora TaxID=1485545 RepID=UPI0006904026|nr:response regulator [Ghiorsea bivora]
MNKPKIMIVDDYKTNRLLIMHHLEGEGYQFIMAEGGQQAIDLIAQSDVDLVLLDIMMPDVDGMDVLKYFKAHKHLCDIPVIMVTALEAQNGLPECLSLGACDYVTKPVQRSVLKARVSTQLSRKKALEEVRESRLHLANLVEEKTRELEQTLGQLYQAQKMEAVGTLAGGLAHDFNNVLTSITGNLYLIKRGADSPDMVRQRVTLMQEICMQASEHIQQLLLFSRKEQVTLSRVDIGHSVRTACDMAGTAISGSIQLACICPEYSLWVYWNDTQIQQILLNLITNASHAVEGVDQPLIQVKLDLFSNDAHFQQSHIGMQDDVYVRLTVQDNGVGMTSQVQSKIFEPFYTTKPEGKGTGLGLSMVIGSVESAGGMIEVSSEPGAGAIFSMYLPQFVEPNATD